MPDFLSYDPLTGVRKLFDYDEMTGKMAIRTEQNVKPLLDRNMSARNEAVYDRAHQEMNFYASIPPVVQLELMKKGIYLAKLNKNPEMCRRFFQEINSNYPYLKVTDKKHA